MAKVVYNIAKKRILDGDLDFNLPADIRCLLLQANSDINADDDTVSAVLGRAGTTELTSTGYARQALANETTQLDDANDRAEVHADNITFTGVTQATTETITGVLYYLHITNDADSVPIAFDDTLTGLPLTPNGSDVTITAPAEGYFQL